MSSSRDFFHREAELDEGEDEELDDATPKKQTKRPTMDDDSSEEEDDDDEQEIAKVREGFIVDDEEEEEEEDEEDERTRRRRKKRRRQTREEEEEDDLDEDDLDLVAENTGVAPTNRNKFKRLKRGDRPREREIQRDYNAKNGFFSDDDEDLDAPGEPDEDDEGLVRRSHAMDYEDMDDFIEEDELEEDERQLGSEDEMRISGRLRELDHHRQRSAVGGTQGIDMEKLDDMEDIFGTAEYDQFLVTEVEEMEREEAPVELKDVFEQSHLAERMLTDEDNEIRMKDIPERFQVALKPYESLEEYDIENEARLERTLHEEAQWIANQMLIHKPSDFHKYAKQFTEAVEKCLFFFIKDNYEVPFVFQHRKDYLIHVYRAEGSSEVMDAVKLLSQDELWKILELDLKFRAFLEKRKNLYRTYDVLYAQGINDEVYDAMSIHVESADDVHDLQDYLHFTYHSALKDAQIASNGAQVGSMKRRPGGGKTFWERFRQSRAYGLVKAFGITADQFAVNVEIGQKREFAEDPEIYPYEMAEAYVDGHEFRDSETVMNTAKRMLAEEILMSPRIRKALRMKAFRRALIHVDVTEKGVRKIDEQHQYYEFKYLRNQSARDLTANPGMFLRMLKAEEEGLVELKVEFKMSPQFDLIYSENMSDVANAWNKARKDFVDMAMKNLLALMEKTFKEAITSECEDLVAARSRHIFYEKLDQAPFRPKGLQLGVTPTVFILSCGQGDHGRDAIVGIYMDDLGRPYEQVKYHDLRDEENKRSLVEVIKRRKPEVIGIAGFSVSTHRLIDDVRKLMEEENIVTIGNNDDERYPIEVIYVQDEVARLYQNSQRAQLEFPDYPPLARYCIALGRYVQSPLLEYASLGKDITSLSFHPAQHLLPEDKLRNALDSAMVDIVNMVGVNINEAMRSPNYIGNLLPYVAGLGPRKASSVVKTIAANGGRLTTRAELVGDPDKGLLPVVGMIVFVNCASFLYIEYDSSEPNADYLDNTRVHPEDYDLGRKMAADALELDEEDVQNLISAHGQGAVISELVNGQSHKVNELILEEYAEELEQTFNQRKRATLETIRAELQEPYEEIRKDFKILSVDEVFTMLTGEMHETLYEGMVVPVNIRRVTDRYVAVRLDCGIEGNVVSDFVDSQGVSVHALYGVGQTVQAKILSLSRKSFFAECSLRASDIRTAVRRFAHQDRQPDEWDEVREEKDRAKMAVTNQEQTRTTRVIKHPLFRPFNSKQAEEYLSKLFRGDAVIRPSSLGMDHIAITWKVHDGIYQHVDVLELNKENEFTVGKLLSVMGKYTYTDLDELMHLHIKAMAKKVDEMTAHEKFKEGTREDCEKWLVSYTQANPKRSYYRFCFDPKHPGYFDLVFKAGLNAKIQCWKVKVIPNAFRIRDNDYPDMTALCNGFKMLFQSSLQQRPSANSHSDNHGAHGAHHNSHHSRSQYVTASHGW